MTNISPTTGIRYGVISLRSLNPETADTLWNVGTDLSYEEAFKARKLALEDQWYSAREEAEIMASETDHQMCDAERQEVIQCYMTDKGMYGDAEEYSEERMRDFGDEYYCDEPIIEGELEGVKYRITWLGGAPILFVFDGPQGYVNRLCSPCVPNAADLDSGFTLRDSQNEFPYEGDYIAYCVPHNWLDKEEA